MARNRRRKEVDDQTPRIFFNFTRNKPSLERMLRKLQYVSLKPNLAVSETDDVRAEYADVDGFVKIFFPEKKERLFFIHRLDAQGGGNRFIICPLQAVKDSLHQDLKHSLSPLSIYVHLSTSQTGPHGDPIVIVDRVLHTPFWLIQRVGTVVKAISATSKYELYVRRHQNNLFTDEFINANVKCARQLQDLFVANDCDTVGKLTSGLMISGRVSESPDSRALDDYDTVYVLDTNVFIDEPDVVSWFAKSDLIVIPKQVVLEIDGLSGSEKEERAGKARQARESIQTHMIKGANVLQADCAMAQSLHDYLDNKDNRILSVALQCRDRGAKVILVTSDFNLGLKARVDGLPTINLSGLRQQRQSSSILSRRQ